MKLLKDLGIIVLILFALTGVIATLLLIFRYRPTIVPSISPNWEAIAAIGQWGGVIAAIFIPVVTVFIGNRIGRSVDNAGSQSIKTIKRIASQNESSTAPEYHSPSASGKVKFDYSNHNGRYTIGENEFMFEVAFSKADNQSIYVYNDPNSISTVALVKDASDIRSILHAEKYDTSSRTRCPKINQIVLLQNVHDFYAAVKILSIQDDSRGAPNDEVEFEYIIQTSGSADFTHLDS